MSRTIRRKNTRWNEYWFVDAWRKWYWEDGCPEVDTKKRARQIARYHSEYYSNGWNAPKGFRQSLNRTFRAKNKAILGRSVRDSNEEPVFIPFIKDANWEYW